MEKDSMTAELNSKKLTKDLYFFLILLKCKIFRKEEPVVTNRLYNNSNNSNNITLKKPYNS